MSPGIFIRNYVVENFGEEEGILVIDETEFLKKREKFLESRSQNSASLHFTEISL